MTHRLRTIALMNRFSHTFSLFFCSLHFYIYNQTQIIISITFFSSYCFWKWQHTSYSNVFCLFSPVWLLFPSAVLMVPSLSRPPMSTPGPIHESDVLMTKSISSYQTRSSQRNPGAQSSGSFILFGSSAVIPKQSALFLRSQCSLIIRDK